MSMQVQKLLQEVLYFIYVNALLIEKQRPLY